MQVKINQIKMDTSALLIIIILIIVICIAIWYFLDNNHDELEYGRNHHGKHEHEQKKHYSKHDCSCLELGQPENIKCCRVKCPDNQYTIWWDCVEDADCYVISIQYEDETTDNLGDIATEVDTPRFAFNLDPSKYTDSTVLTVSVTARNKKCNVFSEKTTISKTIASTSRNYVILNYSGAPSPTDMPLNSPPANISWPTEVADPSGMFDPTIPNQIVVSAKGLYHMGLNVIANIAPGSDDAQFGCGIRVNGENVARATVDKDPTGGRSRGVYTGATLELEEGDVITTFVRGAGTLASVRNSEATHFDMFLISALD